MKLVAYNVLIVACLMLIASAAHADDDSPSQAAVMAAMKPYDGPTSSGTDRGTLTGKVMAGYQGWYNTPDDGAGRDWGHYSFGRREGKCTIDFWPDVTELDADEKAATPFRHADGSVAYVFSSYNRKTVLRHFKWMQDYGIDGAFVQRFVVGVRGERGQRDYNTVLAHCREGANRAGRCYAVMYDLSGLPAGGAKSVITDWKRLVDGMHLGRDPKDAAYVRHNGKPVVAVWGVGFNDDRDYTLAECEELVGFLKNDPKYGGCTVLIGVPTGWRDLDFDSVTDRRLHQTILKADIVSPWTVGRYIDDVTIDLHAKKRWSGDIQWCREHNKEYMPVVFPGFSWHNLYHKYPLDQIPRRKGEFLWKQFVEAKKSGATMVYQAMFDEMDEGTAIFKCTNDPPVGKSRFLTMEGLPSDYYLWLSGTGGKLIRGEIKPTPKPPAR